MPKQEYCRQCDEAARERKGSWGNLVAMRRIYIRGGPKGTGYVAVGWMCPDLHVRIDPGAEV